MSRKNLTEKLRCHLIDAYNDFVREHQPEKHFGGKDNFGIKGVSGFVCSFLVTGVFKESWGDDIIETFFDDLEKDFEKGLELAKKFNVEDHNIDELLSDLKDALLAMKKLQTRKKDDDQD